MTKNMGAYCWHLKVRPGYEDEYKKRHLEIWPEMVMALKNSGIVKYKIFRFGLDLFGYFETEDLEKTKKSLSENTINVEWGNYMKDIMEIDIDPNTNFPYLLPLQWDMEEYL